MISRDHYLSQLFGFIDKPFIKIITGLRRSGKSVLLAMLRDEILRRGSPESNVPLINFESFDYSDWDSPEKLYQFVQSSVDPAQPVYILLDEIQELNNWEKAVNALVVDLNADVYVTGSNSRLLSSELATYLAGRYVEIPVFTLSFREYLEFQACYSSGEHDNITVQRKFSDYLRKGGFPALHVGNYPDEMIYKIVYDIYSSAILRDTVQRFNIRNVELLERVVKYVFDNVGNKFSAKKVADYFKSQQRKIDLNTVYNYLRALEAAFIIYRIPRYDVKGKEILKTNEKYYVGDQSLLYSVMGYKDRLIAGVLENIVMLELLRRGYRVFVGKSDIREIDFVAEKRNTRLYIQVAYLLPDQTTVEREFSTLQKLNDNYPKYVVTMDENWHDNIEGIQHVHIADFLLMPDY